MLFEEAARQHEISLSNVNERSIASVISASVGINVPLAGSTALKDAAKLGEGDSICQDRPAIVKQLHIAGGMRGVGIEALNSRLLKSEAVDCVTCRLQLSV